MPRVHYSREIQGLRPYTNPQPVAHLRGLGSYTPAVRPRQGFRPWAVAPSLGQLRICLDQSQNSVPCSDPNCTYGDCGGTGGLPAPPQQTTGPLCLDQNQNQISCSDPDCTYGDCVSGTGKPATPSPQVTVPQQAGPSTPATVPDGAVVVYQGRWTSVSSLAHSGVMPVVNQVIAAIKSSGLAVRNEQVSDAGLAAKLGVTSGAPFDVTLTIQIDTGMGGLGQPSDVASIVDHAVYVATGQAPLASAITQVGGVATGQPGPTQTGGSMQTPSISSWFESNALWIGLGIAAVVVLNKQL